jgi:hypothetical protein
MSARVEREALWGAARRLFAELSRGAEGGSARAVRLAARLAQPIRFDQIVAAPAWFGEPSCRRADRLRLAGAAAVAPVWRQTLDGATLRRAAQAIGAERLRRLCEAAGETPAVRWPPAERGDTAALEHLGARVLGAAETTPFDRIVAPSRAPGDAPAVSADEAKAAIALLDSLGEGPR